MEETLEGLPGELLPGVARRLDAALPFTRVSASPAPDAVHLADVVRAAESDPLAGWRAAMLEVLTARHATPVRPHIPAAFVLQWWCEVAAVPIAYAAELGPWVVRGPTGLGFSLAPGLHPDHLLLLPSLVVEVVDAPHERGARARAAYLEVVGEVVRHYAPEVRMSSRQRWGVVEDTWRTARGRARKAGGQVPDPEAMRASCCFIYALPGLRACATCPRRRRT